MHSKRKIWLKHPPAEAHWTFQPGDTMETKRLPRRLTGTEACATEPSLHEMNLQALYRALMGD